MQAKDSRDALKAQKRKTEEVEYPSLSCVRLFTFSEQLYVVI